MRRFFHAHRYFCPIAACLSIVALLATVTQARAVTFGFDNITNNSGVALAVGGQLFVDVVADSTTGARFTFRNSGPITSSIADIYFVNAPPLFSGISSIVNGPGVDFSSGASPTNLPAGNLFGMSPTAFSADSNPPAQPNGVNPGENVAIVLALLSGSDFGDVISAMFAKTLRIGIHVQGIHSAASDSFIAATPLPGALPLFATGLASLVLLRGRKKRKLLATEYGNSAS